MRSVKRPCLQCKEKHLKCDETKPQCRRCQAKNLTCTRPIPKTIFRHASAGHFASDLGPHSTSHSPASQPPLDLRNPGPSCPLESRISDSPTALPGIRVLPSSYHHEQGPQASGRCTLPPLNPMISSDSSIRLSGLQRDIVPDQTAALSSEKAVRQLDGKSIPEFPLKDPQEACLFRYFVEELAHWFDLCDENRHFQITVPMRARQNWALLNAIFAVAARHLTRLPQFKTPQGILYQGQLLPELDAHAAVEYMLKCIPDLREFHSIQDDEFRESIIATAVILRQLEEIDEEEDHARSQTSRSGEDVSPARPKEQVNFLAIIDAVLRSPPSQSLFGRRSLIQAAYWMALRQEIYHSFTRKHPPQMELEPQYWHGASKANQIVMHTVQVAKWLWTDRSDNEWARLQEQSRGLGEELDDYQPFFRRPADRSKGEIFPVVWYSSVLEVTTAQLSILSRMVLLAEDPYLRTRPNPRMHWRQVENDVRLMILDLCGISLCHPASPPALLHATIGIEMYGDFFTDRYERIALKGVVERMGNTHAWPVKKLTDMFQHE